MNNDQYFTITRVRVGCVIGITHPIMNFRSEVVGPGGDHRRGFTFGRKLPELVKRPLGVPERG